MLEKIKDTVKHSAIYSLGNLSSRLIGFILLPVYFHYLSIEQYGIFNIFEITGQIVIEVLLISIPTAMMRWYSNCQNEDERKSIIFTSFVFLLIVAILFSLLCIPLAEKFSDYIFNTNIYSTHFKILSLFISFSIINRLILNIIRIKQKSLFYIFIFVISFSTVLICNIYFVVYLGLGIKGVLSGLLLGQIVMSTISIKIVLKNINLRLNISLLKEMLSYGFPLIFSTFSTMVLNFSDRYLIKIFLGEAAVGIYAAGFKITSLINVFVNSPFQLGYLPIAFLNAKKKDAKRFFSKVLTYKTLLLALVIIVMSFWGGNLISFITAKKDYLGAIPFIPIIAFTFLYKGIYYILSVNFHLINKTKYNAYIAVSGAMLNILLNIFFLPKIGLYSAPLSAIIALQTMIIFSYYLSQKKYFIPYELKKIITLIIIGIVYYFLNLELKNIAAIYSVIIKVVLLIVFPFILLRINFFEPIELLRIKEIFTKFKSKCIKK